MKANELMIGDYVTFADCQNDKYPSIIKIWQINEDGESFASIDGGKAVDEITIDDEIVGIPITPKILEKNGIKLKEVGDNGISTPPEWRNRFEKWVLRTQWKDTFIWYDRTAKYWHLYDNMGAAKLLYVHELQHALRLCGIEKEIEL